MEKSDGPTRKEWNQAYACLSPADADQMRLVGCQRARRNNRRIFDYLGTAELPELWIIGSEIGEIPA